MSEEAVAIVGMACRVPGAASINDFRAALRMGRDQFSDLSRPELLAAGVERDVVDGPGYVSRAPVLPDITGFDAEYFGLSQAQAELMDPQHRIFLECALEALEAACIVPGRGEEHIGVFAGASISSYLLFNLLPQLDPGASARTLMAMVGNEKDYLASHTAYLLGLTGPAVGIQTACSSSLVGVHYAVRSLLAHECDAALAGGVNIRVPHRVGYQYEAGSILSPTGACRSFDCEADGTVFGSGAGVVALCRLSDAVRDGRVIHAVILGSAVNNDGRAKAGFTVPSLDGQASVVAEALAVSGLDANGIGYIEGHGTGTPIGDPIEVRALGQVFGARRGHASPVALGSAKATFGHLEAASGVIGLMAAVVAVEDGVLSSVPHFVAPNPHFKLGETPFEVIAQARDWPGGLPRRAGVSSFGIGGTNAHVIIERAPSRSPAMPQEHAARPRIYPVSAKSSPALSDAVARHAEHLRSGDADLAASARTAMLGRVHHPIRLAVVARSREEAAARLLDQHGRQTAQGPIDGLESPRVAFVFSGQGGSSWPDIAGLRSGFPAFREMLDRAAAACPEIAPILRGERAADPADTATLQPALFALQAALTTALRASGIVPHAVCGHSVGEIAAAWAAGMLRFEEALSFAATRGRLMGELTGGAMASVFAEEAAVVGHLGRDVAIAAYNGPDNLVISGPAQALGESLDQLRLAGIESRMLPGQVAFHSTTMERCSFQLARAASAMSARSAQTRFVSTLSGAPVAQLGDNHWEEHARKPVRFDDAISHLVGAGVTAIVEIGPGAGLTALLRGAHADTLTVAPALGGAGDEEALLRTLAWLFARGCDLDWETLSPPGAFGHVPPYPFQRRVYWVAPATPQPPAATTVASIWPDRPAWLADHRVDGKIVMPAAGLIAFALAATGRNSLGPVRFEAMLEIGEAGVELRTAFESDGAIGVMAAAPGEPAQRFASVSTSTTDLDPGTIGADAEGLARVSKADFYAAMASNGIDLGPALQKLDDIRAGAGQATALVSVTAEDAHGFGSPVHPCILDAMFQVLAAATQSALDASGVPAPHVPVSLEGIALLQRQMPAGAMRCRAMLRPADPARGEIIGDIALFDEEGAVLVHVVGLASRPIQANAISFLHEIQWVEDRRPHLPEPERIVLELERPTIDAERHARYVAAIDRLAAAYVARALDPPGPVHERYKRLLNRYMKMLREDGLVDVEGRPNKLQGEPEAMVREICAEFPDHLAETRILARCGASLRAVLICEADPVELLFAPGTEAVGELYGESEIAGALNAMLADAVDRATRERTDLKILEIGGGTGGTTRHVLGRVGQRVGEYRFTDLSPAFLSGAEERFSKCEAFQTALFNVEHPPEEQEIGCEAFDIVIAANVLHAAGDLRDAVAHAGAALASGGWLVLLEGFAPSRWLDLTFGLTTGWWNQRDTDSRPDYPLIDAPAWRKLLMEQGFDGIETVTLGPEGLADQGIILARKCFRLQEARYVAGGLGEEGARDEVLRALRENLTPNARLLVATGGAAQVRPHELPDPAQAAVTGLAKAVALEELDADVRIVDLAAHEPDAAQILAREAERDDGERSVAWRGGRRYVERLAPARKPRPLPARFSVSMDDGRAVFVDEEAGEEEAAPLAAGEVEIAIRAAGLNFKDVLTTLGIVPPAGGLGSECAGIVTRIGSGVVNLRVGSRVVALTAGSLASHVRSPSVRVAQISDGMSFIEAASIPVAAMTACHVFEALAPVEAGAKVLVHTATGGVGYFAIALARAAGAEVFATAGEEWKRDHLRGEGIAHVFDSRSLAFRERIRARAPEGLDLVINTLSGPAIEAGLDLLRPGGRFIELGRANIRSVGEVAASHPHVEYHVVSLDRVDDETGGALLCGALRKLEEQQIAPPPLTVMPIGELDTALATMKRGAHLGKIVLRLDPLFAFHAHRSYLITGGMGGIGMKLAQWAVARGARTLHLTAHSPPHPELMQKIEALRRQGASVHVHEVDLASTDAVHGLLDTITAKGPPLAGLFHAAGRLDDTLLSGLSAERMAFVGGPKSDAAKIFDERLPDLDAFVLFSSAAGVLGSVGQGNHASASAALDAIAEARYARGRHALSIDWGAWSDIGAAQREGATERLKGSGIRPISPRDGLLALELALDIGRPRLVALPLDLAHLARVPHGAIFDNLLPFDGPMGAKNIPQKSSAGSGGDEIARLRSLPVARRIEDLARMVEDIVRQLMNLRDLQLPHDRPLQEAGLDSLMAIELRNRLGKMSSRSLPATLLFNHPTVESLAAFLNGLLFIEPTATNPVDDPEPPMADDEETLFLDDAELDRILSEMEDRYSDPSN